VFHFEPKSVHGDVGCFVTAVEIEIPYREILRSHHKLNLRYSVSSNPLLCCAHHRRPEPGLQSRRFDRQVVRPTSVTVVANHDRRHHVAVLDNAEHDGRLHSSCPVIVVVRGVPGPSEAGALPQRNNGIPVLKSELFNVHQ